MINRPKRSAAALALLACTPFLGACETLPDMPHPLIGPTWKLTDIDTSGSSTRLTPALQERHTITFGEAGRMTMQLDCNRGNATWSGEPVGGGPGTIMIGPVASTRVLCPRPTYGDVLAADLSSAERYTLLLDGRRLIIETAEAAYTFNAF